MQSFITCSAPIVSAPLRAPALGIFFGSSSQRSFAIRKPAVLRRTLTTTRAEGVARVEKSESDWKKELSDAEYYVLRQKGTERPRTGEYDKFYPKKGFFACAGCANPLYSAQSKFDSGCGWPAFDKCYTGGVIIDVDNTLGMRRVEIMCAACDGHLGHVFEGERATPTNERHCVNSISTKYVDAEPPAGLVEAKVV